MPAKKSGGQPGARLPKGPTPQKAEKMMLDNSAQGHPLTKAQKGFFGAIIGRGKASGRLPKG